VRGRRPEDESDDVANRISYRFANSFANSFAHSFTVGFTNDDADRFADCLANDGAKDETGLMRTKCGRMKTYGAFADLVRPPSRAHPNKEVLVCRSPHE
jgi:hypothetical protein